MQLAGGGRYRGIAATMRGAIDDHATGTADAFTTVRVEGHRLVTGHGQLLIQLIEHLKEAHILRDIVDLVLDHPALLGATRLAPDLKCQFHL